MNRILLIVLFVSNIIFSQEGKIYIEGTISNCNIEKVFLRKLNKKSIAESTIKDGKFKISANINRGYFKLTIGNNGVTIYLAPKDKLNFTADFKNFYTSVSYSGIGSERNNYLIEQLNTNSKQKENLIDFYDKDETIYLKNSTSLNNLHKKALKNSKAEDFFKEDENINLYYDYLLSINNFKSFQDFYFERDVKPSAAFLEPLEKINKDDALLYKKYPDYRYLVESIWKKKIESKNSYKEMNSTFHQIKTEPLKKEVFISFYYSIAKNENRSKEYFNLIKNNISNAKFINMAKQKYKAVSKLKRGSKSPTFNYKDISGKEYSLEDFRGKLVYVDVWATWCGPCIKQIPALKKLEHDFKDKDIVFISISVDKKIDFDKWKKLVSKKELKGIQLFSDDAFNSKFIKAYGINSIPSFILIDKKGNIIERKTSKPSSEKIREKLNQYL